MIKIELDKKMPNNCIECMFSKYGEELCLFDNCNDTKVNIEKLSDEEFVYNLNHRHKNCPLQEMR